MVKAIRRDILLGTFLPGEKLQMNELKQHYQVGGTPIREALVQLVWQHFVVMEPQKGFRVAPVSLNELRDILATRRAIAGLALEKAMQRGSEEWELSIITAFHRMERIQLDQPGVDYEEWGERHMDFHMALIKACNSPMMLSTLENIYNQLERYRHIWLNVELDEVTRYHDHGEHKAIMDAVLARDLQKALVLIEAHYQHVIDLAETLSPEKFSERVKHSPSSV
ncbi:GntR family transcriptional regulator [Iodobacter fluviatilis]|uniref:Carbon starvation induced regulator n=2 Tax=Iodobacter TaxID=32014 RepID=A0A377T012_9NEIS|nr:GntR family transcriptional regulator [Iodobacter fluviatilis]STR45926.1 Carbon starvation induced regulator [Iodobacter fluviatilis]